VGVQESLRAEAPAHEEVQRKRRRDVPDHLLCPVCLDAPPNHVYQCRDGHLLSGGCLNELRSRAGGLPPKCPTCRTPLPEELSRCLSAEHSIALLPATCRHCTEKTTRGARVAHERSCPSAPDVTCAAQADGCAWKGRESDRAAHEVECAIVRLRARFDVEREATSRATASMVDALLHTTTSAQQGKNKALRLAAAHDSLAPLVGRLIAGGAEVNAARPGDGLTPLCIACDHGNVVMVARLIAAGGRVNTASTAGVTPLYLAAQNNRLDVVKLLIAAGADVMARVNGATPLHIAAQQGHAGVVSDLIAAGAVNMAHADGYTPLHMAAQIGHAGVVSVLIETPGVDPNAAPAGGVYAGLTPLFLAA
jgi:hypothetical protein